jgi:CMP-N,N'-diacetyllegionaminic acid synthase
MSIRVLGLVPARSGSKGIVGKNLRTLAGRPLLAYTFDAARESQRIDRLVLSTDSEEIAEAGRELGAEVPFLRPPELAADETPMLPVVQHAVAQLESAGWSPDVVIILQPTSPLRRGQRIRDALDLLQSTGCSSVVTVVPIPAHFSPDYAMRIADDRLVTYLPEGEGIGRRQDAAAAYSRDGTVYAVRRDTVMEEQTLYGSDCRPLVLNPSESVNLDTPEDWDEAERRLAV